MVHTDPRIHLSALCKSLRRRLEQPLDYPSLMGTGTLARILKEIDEICQTLGVSERPFRMQTRASDADRSEVVIPYGFIDDGNSLAHFVDWIPETFSESIDHESPVSGDLVVGLVLRAALRGEPVQPGLNFGFDLNGVKFAFDRTDGIVDLANRHLSLNREQVLLCLDEWIDLSPHFSSPRSRRSGVASELSRVNASITGPMRGQGAFGDVYPAVQSAMGRKVAVKIVESGMRPDAVAHAKALAQVRHPNVVVVHDVGTIEVDGQLRECLVMEWIDGQQLDEAWNSIDEEAAKTICEGVILGMTALHDAGMVHHDLRADNIMVEGGHATIIDIHHTSTAHLSSLGTDRSKRLIADDWTNVAMLCRMVLAKAGCPLSIEREANLLQASTGVEMRRLLEQHWDLVQVVRRDERRLTNGGNAAPVEEPTNACGLRVSCDSGRFTAQCSIGIEVEVERTVEEVGVFIVGCDPPIDKAINLALRPIGGIGDKDRIAVHPGRRAGTGAKFVADRDFRAKQEFRLVVSGKDLNPPVDLGVSIRKDKDEIVVETIGR